MSERNAEAASAQAGKATHKGGRGPARRVLDFLGSMTLAITLLMAVAVASAVGTILQQNQPYQDYLINFGPFWFEIFKSLGLFDVYSAGWFLFILAFLIISTGVCVIRNAPFAGAYVTQRYGRPMRGWHAVQIEIDRSLYMNERLIRPNGNFDNVRRIVTAVIARAIEATPGAMPLAAE